MKGMDIKGEVAKRRAVALYARMDAHVYYTVFELHYSNHDEHFTPLPDGQRREISFEGYVRITEPVELKFTAIDDDSIVQSLNEEERKAIEKLNATIAGIRERRNQLLALTHQPEVCETCKGRRFVSHHFEGEDTVAAFDADDQPCPDCNPDGEGVPP
jgi:hypothetical protein